MQQPQITSECTSLIEACTLSLYRKNIFRVTGLPVDASSKEVSRQAQKLQMFEEMGGGVTFPQPAFALATPPTTDEIRDALSRMKEPESRIVDEFFWYWPEEFGASKSDPAIQAMLAGDAERAVLLWRDREKNGSHVALHNMAIMYHMFAVDWTNYHVSYDIDHALDDQIKGYWRKSFERWEKIVKEDETWDMLKERVRSLEDEALTTGFVRRMLRQLPVALDRVNAEAALKLAVQGRMDWARFHVEFMSQTHSGLDDVDSTADLVLTPIRKQITQHLEACLSQTKKSPGQAPELIKQIVAQCQPLMGVYDLFHGKDAHQRSELFDEVADVITNIIVLFQKNTGDNKTFVTYLKTALEFASGSRVRERIIQNISIGDGNIAGKIVQPFFERLHATNEANITPSQKLGRINSEIITMLPQIAQSIKTTSEAYIEFINSIALCLRSISVDAHNQSRDYRTAETAIQLALKLATSVDLKQRIQEDIKALRESEESYKCAICNQAKADPGCVLQLPISSVPQAARSKLSRDDILRGHVDIPRCRGCRDRQSQSKAKSGSGCLILVAIPFILFAGVVVLHFA